MKAKFLLIIIFLLVFSLVVFSNTPDDSLKVKIIELDGQARLQRDIPWWQFWKNTPLSPEDFLIEGDRVQTLSGTNLFMEFPDNSTVWVGPRSLFRIKKVSDEKNSLYMSRGTLGARVIHLIEGIITFEVETPSAVAAVRGTEFSLIVDRNKTIITVYEGVVSFTSERVEVLVGPGETMQAIKGEPPSSFSPLSTTITGITLIDPEKSQGMPDWVREKLGDKIPDHAGNP